jgi:exocyst complex component 1
MFKRVEKHFTEGSDKASEDMVPVVWAACEHELIELTNRVTLLISQHYADSGVSLEFTKADIESSCKRQHRTNA